LADFELGQRTRTLLANQQPESLNLSRLFNEIQDLLGADISLKVPLRDLFGREVFRKLLLATQPSQKLAFKDSLIQDLQSVYSPALVMRLEGFLNGLIGSDADDQTSQLQPQAASPIPAAVALRRPVDDEEVATVMASAAPSAVGSAVAADAVGDAPKPANAAAVAPAQAPRSLAPGAIWRPVLRGSAGLLLVFGVVVVSSRRPCPAGMQCSLASSFGLVKLNEAAINQRADHIAKQRNKAEFLPDLENRRREVEQLQAELKSGTYSPPLVSALQALGDSLDEQITAEQGLYEQYKKDEAIVSSIGIVESIDEAQKLDAARKRLDATPKTSLVRKQAHYQAQSAAMKLKPFLAEIKNKELLALMKHEREKALAQQQKIQGEIMRKQEEFKRKEKRAKELYQAYLNSKNNTTTSRPATPALPPRPTPLPRRPAQPVDDGNVNF